MGQSVPNEWYQDIIFQAIPVKYEKVRTASYERRDFYLAGFQRMMSVWYINCLSRPSKHSLSVVGREITMQVTEGDDIAIHCHYFVPRTLSLRNLVLGYECGKVFPAGVGPGSLSRDAAYWLPSRFSLSVETRRRYCWLRMMFPGARLFQAPIWYRSRGWRHARGREHCRGESGSALSGGYPPDSAKVEGSSIVDESGQEPFNNWGRVAGM